MSNEQVLHITWNLLCTPKTYKQHVRQIVTFVILVYSLVIIEMF